MSEVTYYKGLTIECDSSLPGIKIEGRKVPVQTVNDLFETSELPDEQNSSLRKLAHRVVDNSPQLKSRNDARSKHLEILAKGKEVWNEWRSREPEVRPLLYDADLSRKSFAVDLSGVDFANAVLIKTKLIGANLSGANFHEANLGGADLSGAILTDVNFCRTDLYETDLSHADLTNANLQGSQLAGTILEHATLKNCTIYGLSAWGLRLDGAHQENLIVLYRTKGADQSDEPVESKITVPDLRSAQFIYLLLQNENVQAAFNSLTSKVVLLLGRFEGGGLELLQQLREGLQRLQQSYVPIIFEFARPDDRTRTETVKTLAGLARFVVADLSGPSVPHELYATVKEVKVPFIPILETGRHPYSMFIDLLEEDWVLKPIVGFGSSTDLLEKLSEKIVAPAEQRIETRQRKLRELYND